MMEIKWNCQLEYNKQKKNVDPVEMDGIGIVGTQKSHEKSSHFLKEAREYEKNGTLNQNIRQIIVAMTTTKKYAQSKLHVLPFR